MNVSNFILISFKISSSLHRVKWSMQPDSIQVSVTAVLPLGWDASPSQGYPIPALNLLVPIYTFGWREALRA